MLPLDEKEAAKLNIDDYRQYVKIAVSKINIGPKDSDAAFLKFDEKGMLHAVNVYAERMQGFANHFLYLLVNEEQRFTRREILKGQAAAPISDQMKEAFPHFTRRKDLPNLLDYMLKEGMLEERTITTAKTSKTILVPCDGNGGQR